jgi:ribonuclease HI
MVHALMKETELALSLYSPMGKIHNFSYRLEFSCTNNVTEFKALLLGIENTYNMGCGHLTVFGDSELVVNLVHKIYSPRQQVDETLHPNYLGTYLEPTIFQHYSC